MARLELGLCVVLLIAVSAAEDLPLELCLRRECRAAWLSCLSHPVCSGWLGDDPGWKDLDENNNKGRRFDRVFDCATDRCPRKGDVEFLERKAPNTMMGVDVNSLFGYASDATDVLELGGSVLAGEIPLKLVYQMGKKKLFRQLEDEGMSFIFGEEDTEEEEEDSGLFGDLRAGMDQPPPLPGGPRADDDVDAYDDDQGRGRFDRNDRGATSRGAQWEVRGRQRKPGDERNSWGDQRQEPDDNDGDSAGQGGQGLLPPPGLGGPDGAQIDNIEQIEETAYNCWKREVWSQEKREYCCRTKGLACASGQRRDRNPEGQRNERSASSRRMHDMIAQSRASRDIDSGVNLGETRASSRVSQVSRGRSLWPSDSSSSAGQSGLQLGG